MSVEEANALGFDADSFVASVERDMGGQMSWVVDEGPVLVSTPTGFTPSTEIAVRASIQRLTHMRLDPSICTDGDGVCERDGISVTESECAGHLQADVSVVVSTTDGSLEATMEGYVFQELPGSLFETPVGSMHASLRDVGGSLKVEPAPTVGETSAAMNLVDASLGLNLYFSPNVPGSGGLKGELAVELSYKRSSDDGVELGQAFQPMRATWMYGDEGSSD